MMKYILEPDERFTKMFHTEDDRSNYRNITLHGTKSFFIVSWFSVATPRQVDALLQPFKSTAFEQYNQQTRYELQNNRQFSYY